MTYIYYIYIRGTNNYKTARLIIIIMESFFFFFNSQEDYTDTSMISFACSLAPLFVPFLQ